jgi:hypothetical protein
VGSHAAAAVCGRLLVRRSLPGGEAPNGPPMQASIPQRQEKKATKPWPIFPPI